MEDLDMYCSSPFLLNKMAGVDIDPFEGMECPASGEHDRTESR